MRLNRIERNPRQGVSISAKSIFVGPDQRRRGRKRVGCNIEQARRRDGVPAEQQQQKQHRESENSDGIAGIVSPLPIGGSLGADVTGTTGTTGMAEERHKMRLSQKVCFRDPRNLPQHG